MDSISGDSLNKVAQQHLSDLRVGNNQVNQPVHPTNTSQCQSKLNALSELTEKLVIQQRYKTRFCEKARGLLDDPDWLSDTHLLQLSENYWQLKILNPEASCYAVRQNSKII